MVVCFVKIHIRPYMDDIVTLIRVSDPSLSRLLICLLGCMSTSRVLFFCLSPNVEPDTCFHEAFGALYTSFSLTTVIQLYSNRLKSTKKMDGDSSFFFEKFTRPDAASRNCYCRFVIKIMLGVRRSLPAANSRLAEDFESFIRCMTHGFHPHHLFFAFSRRSFTLLLNKVVSSIKVGRTSITEHLAWPSLSLT